MNKYDTFRRLHQRSALLVIPNPWDTGTARILQHAGFEALATTSAGFACSQGLADHQVSAAAMLDHCRDIVEATPLPVSADLGKGFGDTPEAVADTITRAASTGLAGCSIEDYTGNPEAPMFEFTAAVERIAAACEAKQKLDHDFMLTARCDNYASGIRDLDDTILRLQAYEQAGADVLYPPAMDDTGDIKTVCDAVTTPVNIVVEALDPSCLLSDLQAAGVSRVSLGTGFYLAAMGGLMSAIADLTQSGSLEFLAGAADYEALEAVLTRQ